MPLPNAELQHFNQHIKRHPSLAKCVCEGTYSEPKVASFTKRLPEKKFFAIYQVCSNCKLVRFLSAPDVLGPL